MTKEQQDLAWACLPKEVRAEQREFYINVECEFDNGANYLREKLFGKHNLTSDTEPEEMLMVERKKVVEWYSSLSNEHKIYAKGTTDRISLGARLAMIEELFGDKCLPDKEPSVQVEPKFKVGDKVIVSHFKKVGVVREIKSHPCIGFNYKVETGKDSYFIVHEVGVEPYTNPESRNLSQEIANCDKSEDNMEEKELNLCELLKGCIGEWFYVTPCGEMELKEINKLELKPLHFSRDAINCLTKTDGRAYKNGSCIIYPSRALYEKYPLDARKAWEVWESERKPKFNVKVIIECWQDNDDNPQTKTFGATYSSEEEAQQAAKAVRETLMKIQEQNQK